MAAYQEARVRAASSGSPIIVALAENDGRNFDHALTERTLAVLRQNRKDLSKSARQRWLRKFLAKKDPGLFFGKPPWNKKADVIDDVVHRFRAAEPGAGSRTIKDQIARNGVRLSRSTVQRTLRKPHRPKSPRTKTKTDASKPVETFNILKPDKINQTWHMDLATLNIVGVSTVDVLAVLDGYSRKLLGLGVVPKNPKTKDILAVYKNLVVQFGVPRFVVTDHGGQFQKSFKQAVERVKDPKTEHVKGKVKSCQFNGKAERFFRTLKSWQRFILWVFGAFAVQRHLDSFREWYNVHRCHQGIGGMTPEEMWTGFERPPAVNYLARDKIQAEVHFEKRHFPDEPALSIFNIRFLSSA